MTAVIFFRGQRAAKRHKLEEYGGQGAAKVGNGMEGEAGGGGSGGGCAALLGEVGNGNGTGLGAAWTSTFGSEPTALGTGLLPAFVLHVPCAAFAEERHVGRLQRRQAM